MFRRVPRPSVDLLFRNIPGDEIICDFDSHVKSLLDDLHSTMFLVQKQQVTEQKHQRDQCNKHLKGHSLSLGDKVLLAKKVVKDASHLHHRRHRCLLSWHHTLRGMNIGRYCIRLVSFLYLCMILPLQMRPALLLSVRFRLNTSAPDI